MENQASWPNRSLGVLSIQGPNQAHTFDLQRTVQDNSIIPRFDLIVDAIASRTDGFSGEARPQKDGGPRLGSWEALLHIPLVARFPGLSAISLRFKRVAFLAAGIFIHFSPKHVGSREPAGASCLCATI